ncbi:hypothetical protein [Tsukamurella sputi]|uniref:hypothetical protein n=1 Tax=Tsukamurella sputi TaxID=2591848 RepID=UPI0013158E5D|nr:hypothetical protein [Tsukamurella sputi]
MSDEQAPDAEVEVEFASAVLGRERGAREVLARSPYLDAVISEGHVRVVREVGAPPAALVGVPAPPVDEDAQARLERNPDAIAAIQRAEQDLRDDKAVEVEVSAPAEPAPRRGRGGSR